MRLLKLLAVALVVSGCNTPSLPLPPPDVGALSFSSPGTNLVILTGAASSRHASVTFFALNDAARVGTIVETNADGSFKTDPFTGVANDPVELWYEMGSRRSDTAACMIRIGGPLDSTVCR
jgi:hypothetical protein